MIWRIVFIVIGLVMFFYGGYLAIGIGIETAKTTPDPVNLFIGSPSTMFLISIGLIALGSTLIFVGAVTKRKQSSAYNVS